MKNFLAVLFLAVASVLSVSAQTPGVTQYPTALDTDTTLLTAVNNCAGVLSGGVSNSVTSFALVTTSCFPSSGIFVIDSEYVIYTSKTSTTLDGLTRAALSSSAAAHSSGAQVRMTGHSAYFNSHRDAIKAIQAKLGTGAATASANTVLRGTGSGTTDFGQITNAYVASGAAIALSKLSITGTPDGTKFLRDDGSWQAVGSSGLGDPGGNGIVARISSGTTINRTITGTSSEITITNGDGVSGNPTLALASTFDISGKTSTKPVKTGTSDPATCGIGELLFRTDVTAGSNLKGCTATNTWTTQGGGGGASAWSSLTDPSADLSLAMSTRLTTFTHGGNYGSSSAWTFSGNNTSATGALVEMKSAVSNNMPVLKLSPRAGQSFLATHLGSLLFGKDNPGSTDTDGYAYFGVIGSNAHPSGTPTSNTGFAPIVVASDGITDTRTIWLYAGSKWNDIGGVYRRNDSNSGSGSVTLDFHSTFSASLLRTFTLTGASTTFTFSNPPKAGTIVVISVVQDGTGSRTLTWPASVKWSATNGGTPTLTTTASKRDVFTFVYDGSNYWETARALNQ